MLLLENRPLPLNYPKLQAARTCFTDVDGLIHTEQFVIILKVAMEK